MERQNNNRKSNEFGVFLELTNDPALRAAVEDLYMGETAVEELSEVFAVIAEQHNVTPDQLNDVVVVLLEAKQYHEEA